MYISWLQAAQILEHGGIVAFPTDTVYGLGVSIASSAAVARLYEIKGRSFQKPLVIMCPDIASVQHLGVNWDDDIERIAKKHWPGALTLVFQRDADQIPDQIAADKPTIGIRIPDNEDLRTLLRALSHPLAVTSANLSGSQDLTRAQDVNALFGDQLAGIVQDDAAVRSGMPSAVVDVSAQPWTVLRKGPVQIK